MKKLLGIAIFSFLSFYIKADNYVYKNEYITVNVKKYKGVAYSDSFTVSIQSNQDVLMPTEGCFGYSDTITMEVHFRNISCDLINHGIINSNRYPRFYLLPKDSVVTYQWVNPTGKLLKNFSFNVQYIPTGTKRYKSRKKHINIGNLPNGKVEYSMRIEDDIALRNEASLKIVLD